MQLDEMPIEAVRKAINEQWQQVVENSDAQLVLRGNALRGGAQGPTFDAVVEALGRHGRVDLVGPLRKWLDLHCELPALVVTRPLEAGQVLVLGPSTLVKVDQTGEGGELKATVEVKFSFSLPVDAGDLSQQTGVLNRLLAMVGAVDLAETLYLQVSEFILEAASSAPMPEGEPS